MLSEETWRDLVLEVQSRMPDPVTDTLVAEVAQLRAALRGKDVKIAALRELISRKELQMEEAGQLLEDPPTRDALVFLSKRAIKTLKGEA